MEVDGHDLVPTRKSCKFRVLLCGRPEGARHGALRPGHRARAALKLIDAEFSRIAKRGVTDLELEKAKNRIELGFLHSMETVPGKAEQIGFHETVLGDGGRVFSLLEAYRATTSDDVSRAAQRYLRVARRTRVVVTPKRGGA